MSKQDINDNKPNHKLSKRARRYKDEEDYDTIVPFHLQEAVYASAVPPREARCEQAISPKNKSDDEHAHESESASAGPKKKHNLKKKKQPQMTAEQIRRLYCTTSEVKQVDTPADTPAETSVDTPAETPVDKPDYVAPVLGVYGSIDDGKSTLLDAMTNQSLQLKEAGGITQSLGSRFIPIDFIETFLTETKNKLSQKSDIPGLLVIDNPGHSDFSYLRSVSSSICSLAILVISINDGVKQETINNAKLLKSKNIPFVIVVSKLDTLFGYRDVKTKDLNTALKAQSKDTMAWLNAKLDDIKYELSKLEIESEFYFKNKKPDKVYSIVPLSAKTGVGLGDLFTLLIYLTQNWMKKKITYSEKVNCMILETPKDKVHGYVLDVILLNGSLNIGDSFAIGTANGYKTITIRNLLVPSDLSQLGKKTNWTFSEQVKASCGLRIIGSDLQGAYAGTHLWSVQETDKAELETQKLLSDFEYSAKGVYLLVSSFGELQAGYELFKTSKIPLANIFIGELGKKVYQKVLAQIDGEHLDENKVLAYFGAEPNDETKLEIASQGINLIHSQVLYNLVDKFNLFRQEAIKKRNNFLIRPCELQIIPKFIFNKGSRAGNSSPDPIIMGVKVMNGTLYKNMPIVAVKGNEIINLGSVLSIQYDKKDVDNGQTFKEVCVKFSNTEGKIYGRDFDNTYSIVTYITRESIDIAKRDFKDVLSKEEWKLIIAHKALLKIN